MLTNIPENDPTRGWRNHWFVKNILAELPIVDGFFHTQDIPQMLNHAAKSTTMLISGTVGMMYISSSEHGNMATQMGGMAVGMTAGAVTYNGLYNAGRMLYQYKGYMATALRSEPPSPQVLLESAVIRSEVDFSPTEQPREIEKVEGSENTRKALEM